MKNIWFSSVFLSVSCLFSNPTSPTVISGEVSFDNTDPSILNITSISDRAIVNWESFSNEFTELTQITLPQASSALLNRVTGNTASSLKGALHSNGQIYLINPHGILITPSGKINVGSFVASTLDVDNTAFLSGMSMTFSGDSTASITNMGQAISNAGDIILIGYQLDSSGQLYAELGNASLGAGLEVVLTPTEDQRISVVPSMHSIGDGGINNEGYITAIRTELRADGNIYSLAINHTGYIVSAGINNEPVATSEHPVSAILEAPGGVTKCEGTVVALNADYKGGTIQVLGQEVTVDGILNASGQSGGGTIYVGGSPQGNDPNILAAENTVLGKAAKIYAHATRSGNGGTVSIFANQNTEFLGSINASSGLSSGNGGTVDIFGLESLNNQGTVNVRSYNGMNGTVTLYPPLDILPPQTEHIE